MAFAFALPAIGSMALPALGSVVGGIGSLASAIPVVGGPLGSLIGTGGGGGLAGALGQLGAGNIMGSLGTLGTGIKGMLPALGTHSSGPGVLSGGFGQMYTGADKLLGGLLPNIAGAGVSPSQGYLGALFKPQAAGSAMQGPQIPLSQQFQGFLDNGTDVSQANIDAGLAQMGIGGGGGGGLFGGGFLGEGGGLDKIGDKVAGIAGVLQPFLGGGAGGEVPGVTQQQITPRPIVPGQTSPNKPIMFGGGQTPMNAPINLGDAFQRLGPPTSMNQPSMGGASYNNRLEEIENAVEALMGEEGKVPMGKSPQQRSLEIMYGRPSSMVA